MLTLTAAEAERTAGDPQVVELVALAQEGDEQAFAGLYDRYVDSIFAYIYHRVGQRQTAEDLTGDVFVRALRRIDTFRWKGVDFGAWLMTIARNRVHDYFKSARFRLEAPVEEVFDSPHTAPGPLHDPEGAVLTGESAQAVHAALRQLKGEQAEVLYLRFLRHLNVTETAQAMGKTEGAIKALQYRALKALQKRLPDGVIEP